MSPLTDADVTHPRLGATLAWCQRRVEEREAPPTPHPTVQGNNTISLDSPSPHAPKILHQLVLSFLIVFQFTTDTMPLWKRWEAAGT